MLIVRTAVVAVGITNLLVREQEVTEAMLTWEAAAVPVELEGQDSLGGVILLTVLVVMVETLYLVVGWRRRLL